MEVLIPDESDPTVCAVSCLDYRHSLHHTFTYFTHRKELHLEKNTRIRQEIVLSTFFAAFYVALATAATTEWTKQNIPLS